MEKDTADSQSSIESSIESEDEADQSSQESVLSFSDDGIDNDNHAKLQSFVESLRKDHPQPIEQKKSTLSYTEAEPSQFGARPSRKLTIAEVLPTITDPRLRQSLKVLRNSEKEEGIVHRGGIPGKLAPPLAKRQQDRLDRAAAYDKSKETLSRWIDTIKHNRRAEHVSFPLQNKDEANLLGTKQLLPTSASNPITSLESTIQNILQESGLDAANGKTEEDQIQATEQFLERKVPIEELQARRAALRKQRDLMFREERRARRIRKIKSKAYRRVHRKARDKEAQQERQALAAAGLLNSEEEREHNDRRRAEERMGGRHRESKWAKSAKSSGRIAWDDEAKMGVVDMARRDEELRRRIQGKTIRESDASSTASSSDSDKESDTGNFDLSDAESRRQQQRLAAAELIDDPSQPSSNLASMKFMQRAEAARKAKNDTDLAQLGILFREETDGQEIDTNGLTLTGRQRYGSRNEHARPNQSQSKIENNLEEPSSAGVETRDLDDESEEGVDFVTDASITQPISHQKHRNKAVSTSSAPKVSQKQAAFYSPWLSDPPKTKRSTNDDILQIKVNNHESLEGSSSIPRAIESPSIQKRETQPIVSPATVLPNQISDLESSDEEGGSHSPGLTQEQLIRAGFAGDNVENEFAKEKQELVDEEGDQVVDDALPGWGSWTGEGISKREQKRRTRRFVTTMKGINPTKRKDVELDRVIINEKRVKKVCGAA